MSEISQRPPQVGVRELRQNLSVYLDRVKEGETLEVTEHGRPVAQLAPLAVQPMSTVDRLIAEGTLVLGTQNLGRSRTTGRCRRRATAVRDPPGDAR